MRGARAGVFVGMNPLDFQRLLARDWSRLDGYAVLGTTAALAANRISHTFGLVGPSLVLNMACASSLAAIHYACQSLWSRETDLALAGGVELMLSPDSSIMLAEAGMLSTSGRQRALDAQADGYVRGEGAAVVVLRRLSDVQRGERVYALVRGSALNHNGPGTWVTDPSSQAQADVFLAACTSAAIRPGEVDYVELHGAALPKGDRAEIMAVGAAASDGRAHPCRIGTLTNNIGYLGAAGGLAAAIKVALSLHHRVLPPTINLNAPLSDLADLGLQAQVDLSRGQARRQPRLPGSSQRHSGARTHVWCCVVSRQTNRMPRRNATARAEGCMSCHSLATRRTRCAHRSSAMHASWANSTTVSRRCRTCVIRRASVEPTTAIVWRSWVIPGRHSCPDSRSKATRLPRISRQRGRPQPPAMLCRGSCWCTCRGARRRSTACDVWAKRGCHFGRLLRVRRLDRRLSSDSWPPVVFNRIRARRLTVVTNCPRSRSSTTRDTRASSSSALETDFRAIRSGSPIRYASPGPRCCTRLTPTSLANRHFCRHSWPCIRAGYDVNWSGLFPRGGRCADLPAYAFQRQRFWPEWLSVTEVSTSPAGAPAAEVGSSDIRRQLLAAAPLARSALVGRYLSACVADVLPIDPGVALSADTRWFDLGLTSLVLIQLARRLERDIGVTVPVGEFFRVADARPPGSQPAGADVRGSSRHTHHRPRSGRRTSARRVGVGQPDRPDV